MNVVPTRRPFDRWGAILRYLLAIAVGNLVWELAQLPLYTLWRTGSSRDLAFAALHCAAADVLIAAAALMIALILSRASEWPKRHFGRVAAATLTFGLGYTVLSEYVNTVVRATWAYSDLMPTMPWLGTGLAPLAQWIVIPGLALACLRHSLAVPHDQSRIQTAKADALSGGNPAAIRRLGRAHPERTQRGLQERIRVSGSRDTVAATAGVADLFDTPGGAVRRRSASETALGR
jgi:hypothetical protein